MNFRKYYINGNKLTFTISFKGNRYWNDFMYWLTRITTPIPISTLIYREMVKNPPELYWFNIEPIEPIPFDKRAQLNIIRRNLGL